MSRRTQQGIQTPEGTEALTVGVNVTLTSSGMTESGTGGGMEVKVKVLQGRTPEVDTSEEAGAETAATGGPASSRPATAPAVISTVEQREPTRNPCSHRNPSQPCPGASCSRKGSEFIQEVEISPITSTTLSGLPIIHQTVTTVSSGKHRDTLYIDGKLEATKPAEETITEEATSSLNDIQEAKHGTTVIFGKLSVLDKPLDDQSDTANKLQIFEIQTDANSIRNELDGFDIETDGIEMVICGTMTSDKSLPELYETMVKANINRSSHVDSKPKQPESKEETHWSDAPAIEPYRAAQENKKTQSEEIRTNIVGTMTSFINPVEKADKEIKTILEDTKLLEIVQNHKSIETEIIDARESATSVSDDIAIQTNTIEKNECGTITSDIKLSDRDRTAKEFKEIPAAEKLLEVIQDDHNLKLEGVDNEKSATIAIIDQDTKREIDLSGTMSPRPLDFEQLVRETKYTSPTDSFTEIIHATAIIETQRAPTMTSRIEDAKENSKGFDTDNIMEENSTATEAIKDFDTDNTIEENSKATEAIKGFDTGNTIEENSKAIEAMKGFDTDNTIEENSKATETIKGFDTENTIEENSKATEAIKGFDTYNTIEENSKATEAIKGFNTDNTIKENEDLSAQKSVSEKEVYEVMIIKTEVVDGTRISCGDQDMTDDKTFQSDMIHKITSGTMTSGINISGLDQTIQEIEETPIEKTPLSGIEHEDKRIGTEAIVNRSSATSTCDDQVMTGDFSVQRETINKVTSGTMTSDTDLFDEDKHSKEPKKIPAEEEVCMNTQTSSTMTSGDQAMQGHKGTQSDMDTKSTSGIMTSDTSLLDLEKIIKETEERLEYETVTIVHQYKIIEYETIDTQTSTTVPSSDQDDKSIQSNTITTVTSGTMRSGTSHLGIEKHVHDTEEILKEVQGVDKLVETEIVATQTSTMMIFADQDTQSDREAESNTITKVTSGTVMSDFYLLGLDKNMKGVVDIPTKDTVQNDKLMKTEDLGAQRSSAINLADSIRVTELLPVAPETLNIKQAPVDLYKDTCESAEVKEEAPTETAGKKEEILTETDELKEKTCIETARENEVAKLLETTPPKDGSMTGGEGTMPEITEDDILDDDVAMIDIRQLTRSGLSLREQLLQLHTSTGPADEAESEPLVNFLHELWSELDDTHPQHSNDPQENMMFRTFRQELLPDEQPTRPPASQFTELVSPERSDYNLNEEVPEVGEGGDAEDPVFAVESHDSELTAEISVTMTVVDETGDNFQPDLDAEDDLTDRLFLQMLHTDNILEGEARDIVQRIVNLPGFEELIDLNNDALTTVIETQTMDNIQDLQYLDMSVQSDPVLTDMTNRSGPTLTEMAVQSDPVLMKPFSPMEELNPAQCPDNESIIDEKESMHTDTAPDMSTQNDVIAAKETGTIMESDPQESCEDELVQTDKMEYQDVNDVSDTAVQSDPIITEHSTTMTECDQPQHSKQDISEIAVQSDPIATAQCMTMTEFEPPKSPKTMKDMTILTEQAKSMADLKLLKNPKLSSHMAVQSDPLLTEESTSMAGLDTPQSPKFVSDTVVNSHPVLNEQSTSMAGLKSPQNPKLLSDMGVQSDPTLTEQSTSMADFNPPQSHIIISDMAVQSDPILFEQSTSMADFDPPQQHTTVADIAVQSDPTLTEQSTSMENFNPPQSLKTVSDITVQSDPILTEQSENMTDLNSLNALEMGSQCDNIPTDEHATITEFIPVQSFMIISLTKGKLNHPHKKIQTDKINTQISSTMTDEYQPYYHELEPDTNGTFADESVQSEPIKTKSSTTMTEEQPQYLETMETTMEIQTDDTQVRVASAMTDKQYSRAITTKNLTDKSVQSDAIKTRLPAKKVEKDVSNTKLKTEKLTEEIQILLNEKTIKTVDMESAEFTTITTEYRITTAELVQEQYLLEDTILTEEVLTLEEVHMDSIVQDEAPDEDNVGLFLVEPKSSRQFHHEELLITEAEGDLGTQDEDDLDSDGVDFLMPAEGVPALEPPTVSDSAVKQKQLPEGQSTVSEGPSEALCDVLERPTLLNHPETPPKGTRPETLPPPLCEEEGKAAEAPDRPEPAQDVFLGPHEERPNGSGLPTTPPTSGYSVMTEGDFQLHQIKARPSPVQRCEEQEMANDSKPLSPQDSSKISPSSSGRPPQRKRKKYKAPPVPTKKPDQDLSEEKSPPKPAVEQIPVLDTMQPKTSGKRSFFKKFRSDKESKQKVPPIPSQEPPVLRLRGPIKQARESTVSKQKITPKSSHESPVGKPKTSLKLSQEMPILKQKASTKTSQESPPLKPKVSSKPVEELSVVKSKSPLKLEQESPVVKFKGLPTSVPELQIFKQKTPPKPPLRLTTIEKTARPKPHLLEQATNEEIPALEDRASVKLGCTPTMQEEILEQLGQKLLMIGHKKPEESSVTMRTPRRPPMTGRDLPLIVGPVPLEDERKDRSAETIQEQDAVDEDKDLGLGSLLISLDHPPPGTEVVVQTAETPGHAHSLKIRSMEPALPGIEEARGQQNVGLSKPKRARSPKTTTTPSYRERMDNPPRYQPRRQLLIRPTASTNYSELRITPLQPFDRYTGREMAPVPRLPPPTQNVSNLVFEAPPAGTAYVVFPVSTEAAMAASTDETNPSAMTDHIHRASEAVSVAIMDGSIIPYPHTYMCSEQCQHRPRRFYMPTPEWMPSRECTRDVHGRPGLRRWCSIHHSFHRD